MFTEIAEFFQKGGPTMYITATAGVIGVAITVERGLKLYGLYSQNTALFMSRIKESLIQGRPEDAMQICQMEQKGLLAPVVKAGIERMDCEETLVRQSMESVYLEQIPKINHRISYLNLIANAGMLFGLLGTVLGLIKQFAAVASADASQKNELMAHGISEAMNNTALGLIVALPMLIVHGVYLARATQLTEEIERGASQLLDWIGLHQYGKFKTQVQQDLNVVNFDKKNNKNSKNVA